RYPRWWSEREATLGAPLHAGDQSLLGVGEEGEAGRRAARGGVRGPDDRSLARCSASRRMPPRSHSADPGVVNVLVGAVPEHVLAFGAPGHRPRRPGQDLGLILPQGPARGRRLDAGLAPVPLLVEQ